MRKGTKIIEIAGLRGILTALFIGVCLAAGFIMFPAKVAMHLWNSYIAETFTIPAINIWQGLLLWAGIALSCHIANRGRFLVSFHEPAQLNEEEMRILMERVRLQAKARKLNSMIMKSEELNKITTNSVSHDSDIKNVSENIDEKNS